MQEPTRYAGTVNAEHSSEKAVLTVSEQKALQAIREAGQVSRHELENLIGVGTTRAVVLLKRLVELEKIQKVGNGKNTGYQCKQD